MFDLDNYIGVHARALQVSSQRTELIARNLANADTPGYKAQDIDFRAALAQAGSAGAPLALATTQSGHQLVGANASGIADPSSAASLKYRNPLAPSLDGNTVDAQIEQGAFAENALRFQATLTFLNSRFRGLMTAITGQ
jgi:flagellar basal-body rod protein FlgB